MSPMGAESFGLENTQPAPPHEATTRPARGQGFQQEVQAGTAALTTPPRKEGAAHDWKKGERKCARSSKALKQ